MFLNQATFDFIQEFEKGIENGSVYTRKELVHLFKSSPYYLDLFEKHQENAIAKAIGWAVKRSKNWIMNHGRYVKQSVAYPQQESFHYIEEISVSRKNIMTPFSRKEYIEYLSKRLYESLIVKNQLQDEVLRRYHFRSKKIGDELFFVQETFFKEKDCLHKNTKCPILLVKKRKH
jgi:intein/homing endonuclease